MTFSLLSEITRKSLTEKITSEQFITAYNIIYSHCTAPTKEYEILGRDIYDILICTVNEHTSHLKTKFKEIENSTIINKKEEMIKNILFYENGIETVKCIYSYLSRYFIKISIDRREPVMDLETLLYTYIYRNALETVNINIFDFIDDYHFFKFYKKSLVYSDDEQKFKNVIFRHFKKIDTSSEIKIILQNLCYDMTVIEKNYDNQILKDSLKILQKIIKSKINDIEDFLISEIDNLFQKFLTSSELEFQHNFNSNISFIDTILKYTHPLLQKFSDKFILYLENIIKKTESNQITNLMIDLYLYLANYKKLKKQIKSFFSTQLPRFKIDFPEEIEKSINQINLTQNSDNKPYSNEYLNISDNITERSIPLNLIIEMLILSDHETYRKRIISDSQFRCLYGCLIKERILGQLVKEIYGNEILRCVNDIGSCACQNCIAKENKISKIDENKIPEIDDNKIPEIVENKISKIDENKIFKIDKNFLILRVLTSGFWDFKTKNLVLHKILDLKIKELADPILSKKNRKSRIKICPQVSKCEFFINGTLVISNLEVLNVILHLNNSSLTVNELKIKTNDLNVESIIALLLENKILIIENDNNKIHNNDKNDINNKNITDKKSLLGNQIISLNPDFTNNDIVDIFDFRKDENKKSVDEIENLDFLKCLIVSMVKKKDQKIDDLIEFLKLYGKDRRILDDLVKRGYLAFENDTVRYLV
ncbi:hypothetical protein DMUE_1859 [Dictyocoela muelleri]|nr:hypothetical protein DMUE_1859 [Dictyocoela muelleri]